MPYPLAEELRARSRAEFIARLGTVAEEADETESWLDVMKEAGLAVGPEFPGFLATQNGAGAEHQTRKSLDP